MQVNHIGKFGGDSAHLLLKHGILESWIAWFNGCGVALDVREYGMDLRNFLAHLRLEHAHKIMGLFERHLFIQLQVLFDMKFPIQVLDVDVVHAQVVSCRNRVNTIENALASSGAWKCTNRDVGLGKHTMHSICYRACHVL